MNRSKKKAKEFETCGEQLMKSGNRIFKLLEKGGMALEREVQRFRGVLLQYVARLGSYYEGIPPIAQIYNQLLLEFARLPDRTASDFEMRVSAAHSSWEELLMRTGMDPATTAVCVVDEAREIRFRNALACHVCW